MWCIPKLTPEFKERMEDLIDLYGKPYNPKEPVVCLDEKSKQLLADSRPPRPTASGKIAIQDYEYVRKGTANIFVAVEPRKGQRVTAVTKQRKKPDYATFVEKLIAVYRHATTIHLVQDNLNIHFLSSLIEGFGARKAKRLWKRFTCHYTPKHASWLNMAEIEIGAISKQCLDRRIASIEELDREVRACTRKRNEKQCKINWQFTREKAEKVFPELYSSKLI